MNTLNKNSLYAFIAASLAIIIPAPGRFAIGLLLAVELNVIMLAGICARYLLSKLNLGQLAIVILTVLLVVLTMLFRQILALCLPITALQIGFIIYLPTVSSFFIGYLFCDDMHDLKSDLKNYMIQCLSFSLFALVFTLFRDIAGFGTITYIDAGGIEEIVLCNPQRITALSFLATIPGAFITAALFLVIYVYCMNKIQIVNRSEHKI